MGACYSYCCDGSGGGGGGDFTCSDARMCVTRDIDVLILDQDGSVQLDPNKIGALKAKCEDLQGPGLECVDGKLKVKPAPGDNALIVTDEGVFVPQGGGGGDIQSCQDVRKCVTAPGDVLTVDGDGNLTVKLAPVPGNLVKVSPDGLVVLTDCDEVRACVTRDNDDLELDPDGNIKVKVDMISCDVIRACITRPGDALTVDDQGNLVVKDAGGDRSGATLQVTDGTVVPDDDTGGVQAPLTAVGSVKDLEVTPEGCVIVQASGLWAFSGTIRVKSTDTDPANTYLSQWLVWNEDGGPHQTTPDTLSMDISATQQGVMRFTHTLLLDAGTKVCLWLAQGDPAMQVTTEDSHMAAALLLRHDVERSWAA